MSISAQNSENLNRDLNLIPRTLCCFPRGVGSQFMCASKASLICVKQHKSRLSVCWGKQCL